MQARQGKARQGRAGQGKTGEGNSEIMSCEHCTGSVDKIRTTSTWYDIYGIVYLEQKTFFDFIFSQPINQQYH